MKVENNQNKKSVIETGDIFYERESKSYYMLIINLEKRYYLHGLDGEYIVGNFYESLDRARNHLQEKLDEGYYIHYPQSKYKLVLDEV